MKEIKDDINRWRDIPCSWVGRINIVKMAILYYQTQSTDSLQPLSNYQWHFFAELEQKISQFIWKHKRPRRMELKESSFLTSVILQSYSHQDSMVMEQKQKYRPMEQDRKPRNKPMNLWLTYF